MPRAPALRLRLHQSDGFPNAWSATPCLMPPCDQVAIHMENVCHPQPVMLDAAKLCPERAADCLLTPRPTAELSHQGVSGLSIVGVTHVSEQRYRLLWPHDDLLAQPGSMKWCRSRISIFRGKRGDFHHAHVCASAPTALFAPQHSGSHETTPIFRSISGLASVCLGNEHRSRGSPRCARAKVTEPCAVQ